MTIRSFMILLAGIALLAGCAAPQRSAVHASLRESPQQVLPRKVLMIPPDIRVSEVSAGGMVEKVDAWSEQARRNVLDSVRDVVGSKRLFEMVEVPQLSAEDKAALDQHVALYGIVSASAFAFGRSSDPAWAHKAREFDYTLGPGLGPLAQRAGADAALIVVGQDYVSTSERKATMIVGALFGVAMPAGPTVFTVGVVDLKTGNLLWHNYNLSVGAHDLRDRRDAESMVQSVFLEYPGLQPLQPPAKQ